MPPTEKEVRAAIASADHALGHTRATESRPPAHVLPVPPAADGQPVADEQVAEWSKQLGFASPARRGRITKAD